jgi:predicted DNA-binding antitoxin AbrB/MazE fold protein
MAAYPKLRARYSKGTLKLRAPLRLRDGTEVQVSVTPLARKPNHRRTTKRKLVYPNRPLPSHRLKKLIGVVSLGGDALADSESLYDGQ